MLTTDYVYYTMVEEFVEKICILFNIFNNNNKQAMMQNLEVGIWSVCYQIVTNTVGNFTFSVNLLTDPLHSSFSWPSPFLTLIKLCKFNMKF